MKKLGKALLLGVALILLMGFVVQAASPMQIYLPMITNGQGVNNDPTIQASGMYNGLIGAVPLTGERLLVLTIQNDANFVAYIYDKYGAQTFVDGWTVFGAPSKIGMAGCVWIVTENSATATISAHKVMLPVDVTCEKEAFWLSGSPYPYP